MKERSFLSCPCGAVSLLCRPASVDEAVALARTALDAGADGVTVELNRFPVAARTRANFREIVSSVPLPPIGPGESFFVSRPDEYGLSLLVFPNAPVSLDNEPLPIRICGLTNTVIHLGWGKYHQAKPQTTFVFKDCDNVVLKVGALIVHADEPKDPPPLYQTENCRRVRVYEIDTRYVGADPLQTNAVKAVSGSVR